MSENKQYLVYQAQRHYIGEVYLSTTHVIVTGPIANDAEANAEAKRRWRRDQRCYVREIGDTTGLTPGPEPACRCREHDPDPDCLFGPYLCRRANDIEDLMAHPGFAFLTAGIQNAIVQQYKAWQRKYLLHLLRKKQ
jgi:hypothetical protein